VRLVEVTRDRIPEAAETLARAMLDEPGGRYLLPDPDEFLAVHRGVYAHTIERALDEGRVDAWGDPIAGVAVWFRRLAIDEAEPVSGRDTPARRPTVAFAPHATKRLERYAAVVRELRERARPDPHAYLDTIGVPPDHRRRGIASRLLDAGHAWADGAGLPCALDTFDDENVGFYLRRGYWIVTTVPLAGSALQGTAMRRQGHSPVSDAPLASRISCAAPRLAGRSHGIRGRLRLSAGFVASSSSLDPLQGLLKG
jgi:GNAT superfamily N-acetyltransferase